MNGVSMFSIIIPVYNTSQYLRRCIDSIVYQFDETDGEILLINDGSPDDSEQICLEYVSKYSFIKYCYKENGGLSSARNYGIDRANGEYLLFVDSDDELKEGVISHIKALLKENRDVDIITFSLVKRFSNGYELELIAGNYIMENQQEMLYHIFDNKGADVYPCNKVFSRKLFSSLRFPNGKLYEDMYLIPQLFMISKKVIFTSFVGYIYYIHSQSITASSINYKQLDNIRNRFLILKKIKGIRNIQLLQKVNEVIINGFLSTGFKVILESDLQKKKYFYQKLKKMIFVYIKINKALFLKSFKFKQYIALFLLCFIPTLFNFLYKIQQKRV